MAGSSPSLIVRVAANISELRANLAEGKNQIETTTASMARLSSSFQGDKLIQTAHNVVAAIDKIGNASMLSEAEQARVNSTLTKAIEKYQLLGKEAPAAMIKLQQETAGAGQKTESFSQQLGKVNTLLGAFGAAVSIQALIGFGKEVLEVGDKVQKMADQTNLSTTEVQRLMYIAGQSGTGMEALISATQNLQVRIGNDDAGMVGALKRMNINLNEFKSLGTYEQMTLLADRVRAVKDPTDQASLAAALFGKNWKEILPAIKSGMKEVGDQAPIMADATIKSLDRIGDTLTSARQHAVAWGGSFVLALDSASFAVTDFISKFNPNHFGLANSEIIKLLAATNDKDGLAGAFAKSSRAAEGLEKGMASAVKVGMQPLAAIVPPTKEELAKLNAQLDINREQMNKTTEAAKKLADEGFAKMKARLAEIDPGTVTFKIVSLTDAVSVLSKEQPFMPLTLAVQALKETGVPAFKTFNETLGKTKETINDIERQGLPNFMFGLENVGKHVEVVTKHVNTFRENLRSTVDAVAGILNNIGGKWAEFGAIVARTVGAVMDNLKSGNVLGAVVAGVTGAISAIGKLFSSAEKQVNPVRQAFVDAAGGLAVLNVRAHTAGVTLTAMLNAKNPEQYKRAIDELNAALKFQDDSMKTLNETTAKYGFTLAELGPTLQRQELDKQAQTLYQDFQVLTAAGLDHTVVLGKMAGGVNDYIHNALSMGVEVPDAMRPMLEEMVRMGTLTDASGNAITDLSASGVSFSMTMSEGFKSLISTVEKLTDAIARGLGLAIENVPRPDPIHFPVIYDFPDVEAPEVTPMADGGFGTVDKPTLFLAGEAGRESFAFSGANKAMPSSGGGGDMSKIEKHLIELNRNMSARDRSMRTDLMYAVRDGIAQRGRR